MIEAQSNPVPQKPIAFFDFDGTLTKGDTFMPFLKYAVGSRKYYLKLILLAPVFLAYFAKLLRNDRAKQIVLKCYVAGYDVKFLLELGERFSRDVIPKMLRSEGIERLQWHKEQGHECILVSASFDVYLKHWGGIQGFSNVLCSQLDVASDGRVTGKILGENCFGTEKVSRIKHLLAGNLQFRESYAYGDSQGDMPMLKTVDHGYLLKAKLDEVWNRVKH